MPLGSVSRHNSQTWTKEKQNRYSYSKAKDWLRYGMLIIFIIAMIVGVNSIVALLAPYSSYGRIVNNVFQPIYIIINNGLAHIAVGIDCYAFYSVNVWIKSLTTLAITVATLFLISILAWRNGRTYCNTICTVGMILVSFASFSWLKINFDNDKCRKCGKCTKNCKAGCIDFTNGKVDYSRCVVCGNFVEQCSFDALHYCHNSTKRKLLRYNQIKIRKMCKTVNDGFSAFHFLTGCCGDCPKE